MSSTTTTPTKQPKSSPQRTNQEDEFMSNFSLSLIHKILLTDPVDFPELTMNGLPKAKQIYFHTFVQNRGFSTGIVGSNEQNNNNNNQKRLSIEEQISKTMYRAYNDRIMHEMEQSQYSYKPLQNILLEIHTMLRSVIPNRPDLHSFLNDEDVIDCPLDSFSEISKCLKKVADALSQLESEYRFESTKQWLDVLDVSMTNHNDKFCNGNNDEGDNDCNNEVEEGSSKLFLQEKKEQIQFLKYAPPQEELDLEQENNDDDDNQTFSMSYTSFALASATFLHYKAELCQAETADFQLGHILAPRIHKLGKQYLFVKFQEKYKSMIESKAQDVDVDLDEDLDLDVRVPNTKIWIKEMVEETPYTHEELLTSEEKRGEVIIQTGWIDNLLFRSPRSINEEDNNEEEEAKTKENSSPRSVSASTQFLMPEVLWLDTRTIRDIRMTTKISVVGSVLALHAASAAGVSDNVFKRDPLESIIEACRVKLTAAMNDRSVASQEIYESNIGNAVIDLVKGKSSRFFSFCTWNNVMMTWMTV